LLKNAGDQLRWLGLGRALNTASLISASKMRSDCGDLRVTDSDGATLLPYWIEPGTCNTASTAVWVNVTNIPASGTKTIFIYYGNSTQTSVANPSAVFIFFDNFSSDPNTNGKWVVYRYAGDASNEFVWDSTNRRVYLTKATSNLGVMAFFRGVTTPSSFRVVLGSEEKLSKNMNTALGFATDVCVELP